MAVIYQMTKEFPWLNYCVRVCTISDVPELYDISHVFEREARWLSGEEAKNRTGILHSRLVFNRKISRFFHARILKDYAEAYLWNQVV